jgi:hypothetical protein
LCLTLGWMLIIFYELGYLLQKQLSVVSSIVSLLCEYVVRLAPVEKRCRKRLGFLQTRLNVSFHRYPFLVHLLLCLLDCEVVILRHSSNRIVTSLSKIELIRNSFRYDTFRIVLEVVQMFSKWGKVRVLLGKFAFGYLCPFFFSR